MALWKDASTPTVHDLRLYESGILDMASTENVDLGDKLLVARREVGNELQAYLHEDMNTAAADLNRTVVTPHLRQWLVLHTLSVVYRDAHFNQVSPRYKGKWNEYAALANEARRNLWIAGVGLVHNPLYRPGGPQVATISGPQPAGSYFVRVSWVSDMNEESEASEIIGVVKMSQGLIAVTVSGAPSGVMGWNVFVGTSEDTVRRQNQGIISVADTWTEPSGGLVNGESPGHGQDPDVFIRRQNILMRG